MRRLYIIEGLPCSGKSTASAFAADVLRERGEVCYIDEGSGNHPADYEFHAYLSRQNLECFSPEQRELIESCSLYNGNGYIVPLSEFEGELFEWLLRYKIYDFLPWKVEMSVMLDKWRSFVEAADKDITYVFNCVLLQNPMCETMMRFGFSEEQSLDYIMKIAEITEPMKPAVIYLKNDDIAQCIEKTAKERDGWLEQVIDYHVNGAYGKSICAEGFDGYISCLMERQKRELSILKKLPVESIVIDNPHRGRSAAYKEIRRFINKEIL